MMILGFEQKNLSLKRVIDRIRIITRTLKPNLLHVLRDNNQEADNMANEAIGRPPGTLGVEGKEGISSLV
jgi:hypothetical protein